MSEKKIRNESYFSMRMIFLYTLIIANFIGSLFLFFIWDDIPFSFALLGLSIFGICGVFIINRKKYTCEEAKKELNYYKEQNTLNKKYKKKNNDLLNENLNHFENSIRDKCS